MNVHDDAPALELMFEGWVEVDERFGCCNCGKNGHLLRRDPNHDSHWGCPGCGAESYSPSITFAERAHLPETPENDFNEMESLSCR